MRLTRSLGNWFRSGFLYAMTPGVEQDGMSANERWYRSETIGGFDEYDIHVIRAEIKEWLDDYCPGRYRISNEGRGPDETWLRPVYFKTRMDATIFKMHWQGQTPTGRTWEDDAF